MRILIDGDATPDIEKIAFLCDKYDIKIKLEAKNC